MIEITELTERRAIHDKAISVCWFKSAKWEDSKHLAPLASYLKMPAEGYDLLIFLERGMEALLPELPSWVRVLVVDQPGAEPYARHLWRYYGALFHESYRWIWFRGTDTTAVPAREQRLEHIADVLSLEAVTFPSWSLPFYCCTGRFAVAASGAKALCECLADLKPALAHWHCDEETLSNWHQAYNLRTLLAIDRPVMPGLLQDYIDERLRSGNHTVVVKDRDDSPPIAAAEHA